MKDECCCCPDATKANGTQFVRNDDNDNGHDDGNITCNTETRNWHWKCSKRSAKDIFLILKLSFRFAPVYGVFPKINALPVARIKRHIPNKTNINTLYNARGDDNNKKRRSWNTGKPNFIWLWHREFKKKNGKIFTSLQLDAKLATLCDWMNLFEWMQWLNVCKITSTKNCWIKCEKMTMRTYGICTTLIILHFGAFSILKT